jgi:hypothetical protein
VTDRLRKLLPLAAAGLLLLVPYREFFSTRVPAARDLLFYFYPAKAALAEAVRAGEVPWIDRYRWGGVPLLPGPGAAPFDPGNLLFVLLPLGAAAKAWILLRLLTGLAGFAAFGRRIGLSPWAASAAGLLYALSGPTVSAAPFLSTSAAHSVLPWLGAFVLDARRSPGGGTMARLGAAAALILVSGAPEYVFYAALLAAALVLGRPPDGDPAPPAAIRRTATTLLTAGLLAALLAAPALLGGLATISESSRTAEGGYRPEAAAIGALPPQRLVELLSDGLVADWTRVHSAPGLGSYYPHVPSITPGLVALVLAAAGLFLGGAGRFRALALASAGVLLALGTATPAWPLAARVLPILGSVRFPERHIALAGFAVVWLSALGLRRLERRLAPKALPAVVAGVGILVLAEREGTARRLVDLEPAEILTSRPEALRPWPRFRPEATPPRFVNRDSLVPVPKFAGLGVVEGSRLAAETLMPEYPALFGIASLFALDYDLTLPAEAVEWTRLLQTALPQPGPMPMRLLSNAGASAVVRSERTPAGGWAVVVDPLAGARPPWRFASRVVSDPDGRRLFKRFLEEGVDPEAAYLEEAPGGEHSASAGRIVSVRDRPSALTIVTDVDGPGDALLMLFRLRQTCAEATLDGRPLSAVPADFGFTGVRVPPGRHVVRLRPETRWVKMGLVGTLGGSVAWLALALRDRRRRGAAPSR